MNDSDRMRSIDFAAANRNSGLYKRSRFISQSRPLDMLPMMMLGRIHDDMFFQDRYLLNEVNVKIKLVRSSLMIYCIAVLLKNLIVF